MYAFGQKRMKVFFFISETMTFAIKTLVDYRFSNTTYVAIQWFLILLNSLHTFAYLQSFIA